MKTVEDLANLNRHKGRPSRYTRDKRKAAREWAELSANRVQFAKDVAVSLIEHHPASAELLAHGELQNSESPADKWFWRRVLENIKTTKDAERRS